MYVNQTGQTWALSPGTAIIHYVTPILGMDHLRFTAVVSRGATAQEGPAWQTECPPGPGAIPVLTTEF
jgi:hypothetical protein